MAGAADSGLLRDLRRELGDGALLAPSEWSRYRHDASIQRGLTGDPDAVVLPRDGEEVARALRWCYAHGVGVVPRGGGTGLTGGAVPVDGGVVVGLERLHAVRAFEPALGELELGAGMSTAHVARLARENGLLFAPDPGAAELSQIGGNVATNAGGPHAFGHGRTAAFVGGLEAALAPGELVRFGSRAGREAAGYDLAALLVGSEGTLGIVTAVTLSLVPAPEATRALVAFLPDGDAGQRALLGVLGSGLRPAVLDFLDARAFGHLAASYPGTAPAGAGLVLLLELAGGAAEVDRECAAAEEVLEQSGAVGLQRPPAGALWRWRDGANGVIAGVRGGKVSEDIAVPVTRLQAALEAVYAIGAELSLEACAWGHAGEGIIHATFPVDLADGEELERGLQAGTRVLELAIALGGSITGEHGVGWVKRSHLAAQLGPVGCAALRHVKAALDPRGLLNPGKKEPADCRSADATGGGGHIESRSDLLEPDVP